jgi:hypothetical protein
VVLFRPVTGASGQRLGRRGLCSGEQPRGVAAWARELMLERQREGLAKAKADGKYKGLPRLHQWAATMGPAAIAKHLGIARHKASGF